MAYKKRIVDVCYNDYCEKEARWEVFNRWNSSLGKFCRYHAGVREQEQNHTESSVVIRTDAWTR